MWKSARLGAAVLVLCGLASCGTQAGPAAPSAGSPAPSTPPPPPTAEQVEWLSRFCTATAVFSGPPEPPADLRDEFASMDLDSYLSSVDTALDNAKSQIATLGAAAAFPRGAELVASYSAAVKQLGTKVDGYRSQQDAAEDVVRGFAAETSAALKPFTPAGLDLAALTAADGTVAMAREKAEGCRPAKDQETSSAAPVNLPAAKDGTNLAACADGKCEVLVSPSTVVPAPRRYGFTVLRVRSITGGVLLIGAKLEFGTMMSPLTTGTSTIMNGVEVKAVAVGDGKAVLSLSLS